MSDHPTDIRDRVAIAIFGTQWGKPELWTAVSEDEREQYRRAARAALDAATPAQPRTEAECIARGICPDCGGESHVRCIHDPAVGERDHGAR